MERVVKDVFIGHICRYLDGKTLARLCRVCRRFRDWITLSKSLSRLIHYHHVWIDHPCEFLDAIGVELHDKIEFVHSLTTLGFEGVRSFKRSKDIITFNDWYVRENQAIDEIDRVRNVVKNFLLIEYEPLVTERYNLGRNMGTIHRGTSIVIWT